MAGPKCETSEIEGRSLRGDDRGSEVLGPWGGWKFDAGFLLSFLSSGGRGSCDPPINSNAKDGNEKTRVLGASAGAGVTHQSSTDSSSGLDRHL